MEIDLKAVFEQEAEAGRRMMEYYAGYVAGVEAIQTKLMQAVAANQTPPEADES